MAKDKTDSLKEEKKNKKKTSAKPVNALDIVTSFARTSLGDKLYLWGSIITRYRKNYWRSFKKAMKRFGAGLLKGLKLVFGFIAWVIKTVWTDITMPFRKLAKATKEYFALLKSTKGRDPQYRKEKVDGFFKDGWNRNKYLLTRMFNYVVPAISLVLCVMVMFTMLNLNYAIAVRYNGQTIGYIENEGIYESARKIIESRIISGSDEPIWSNDTELSIAVVATKELVSQDIMAESLLKASESEIKDATGIYIGGVFYGAAEDGAMLMAKIEALKEPFLAAAQELGADAQVKFAREVEFVSGIFPASSVKPLEELLSEVTSSQLRDIYVTAGIGDSAISIAKANGISLEQLSELNPSVTDFTFSESGAELLVARAEPLIRVKIVRVFTYTEYIGFGTDFIMSSDYDTRTAFVLKSGVPGERTITKEIEYDENGKPVMENIISEEVTKEPENQEIVLGTQDAGPYGGGGTFAWPTGPGYYYVSRGWIPGVHFAIDIAAPYGTPIYAADGGVVTAALHTSEGYGNYIIVDHGNGIQTLYAHCSTLLVQPGQYVGRGTLIALVGSTGNSTGNHLHFEVYVDGIKVPPEPWIGYGG